MNIYVYNKQSLILEYKDSGAYDNILKDLPSDCDFTLTPPPDYNKSWRWVDAEWVEADKPEEEKKAERWEELKAERRSQIMLLVYSREMIQTHLARTMMVLFLLTHWIEDGREATRVQLMLDGLE